MSDPQAQDFPIRFFGGATTVFQYGGLRFVTDPTFDGPGDFDVPGGLVLVKTAPAKGSPGDLGPVDVALLSHEHPDHLDASGRELLTGVPLILTAVGGGQGLGNGVKGLADFESVSLERPDGGFVTVTAVPAIHGPAPREEIEPVLGAVIGFVLTGEGLPTVYISGDNASVDEVKKIAERFAPVDTAIIYAGAPRFSVLFDNQCIVLDSARAAEAARILDAGRVLPVHYDGWTHLTEGRDDLQAAFSSAGLADRLYWGLTD
ncbi:MBL fold metallo-hydrolase [Streptomyces mexicanus]|uniref:MBL fold metallo-hydrolase n=1 Tax=Streptomyces mexicanus TaxID=178566 RepID=UPI003660ADCE